MDDDRRVAEPLFSSGENFAALVRAYEDNVNGTSDKVKALIGRADEDWIVNTCVIRVSYAMNQSGVPDMRLVKREGLSLISDRADISRGPYAYRVQEFSRYLIQRYGRPSVIKEVASNSVEDPRAPFKGKKGVILFVVNSWSDATGHFDLWDGDRGESGEVIHEAYFNNASYVFLWE